MLKREEEENKENYPWLDKSNERKYMTDREILISTLSWINHV